MLEEMRDLRVVISGRSRGDSIDRYSDDSLSIGTARIFASPPASSSIFSMPIGRQRTTTPVMSGTGEMHEHVARIAVVGQRLRDVAVVARIMHRRRHEAVDEYRAGFLVHLVLDGLAVHRDLDDDVAVVRHILAGGDAVEAHA